MSRVKSPNPIDAADSDSVFNLLVAGFPASQDRDGTRCSTGRELGSWERSPGPPGKECQ